MKKSILRNKIASIVCNDNYDFIAFTQDVKKQYKKYFHQLSKQDWNDYMTNNNVCLGG